MPEESLSMCIGELAASPNMGRLSLALGGAEITNNALFVLEVEDFGTYRAMDMASRVLADSEDLTSIEHESADGLVLVRVDLMRSDGGIRVATTCAIRWPDTPRRAFLRLPWLAGMTLPGAVERFPAMPEARRDGQRVAQIHEAFPLPLCLIRSDGSGIAAHFDVPAAGLSWDRLRNQDLNRIENRDMLRNHHMPLRVDGIPALVSDILLTPLTEGWIGCFRALRERIRRDYDLAQYRREDLAWMREAPLGHFAYVYGNECFDAQTGLFNMNRLLDQGEAFGGYDTVLIWHQYPRLGLDARSQWDFFDEFPGGLRALRQAVDTAHARGTRVLLPFKPWDRAPEDNDNDTTQKLCRVIRETDADGVFFDTMSTVPVRFRRAVDAVKPGVVFETEIEPRDQRSIEMITASWDQYWSDWSMPEAPIFRYLFPEHAQHMIARWHMGAQKDNLIKRCLFNGSGLVIWQDVFGAWLPFDEAQKREISRLKRMLRECADCFVYGDPVPLLPALAPGVLINLFQGEERAALTIYNDAEGSVEGALIDALPYAQAEELSRGAQVQLTGGTLTARIEPGEVLLVLLKGEWPGDKRREN